MFILPEYVNKLKLDVRYYLRVHKVHLERSSDQLKDKSNKLQEENERLKKQQIKTFYFINKGACIKLRLSAE